MIDGMYTTDDLASAPDLLADLCPRCTGDHVVRDPGRPVGAAPVTCPECDGTGRLSSSRRWRNDGNPPPVL